jgi:hypothetical protein
MVPMRWSRKHESANRLSVRWLLVAFAAVLLGPVLAIAAVALSYQANSERTRYENEGREAAWQIAADPGPGPAHNRPLTKWVFTRGDVQTSW